MAQGAQDPSEWQDRYQKALLRWLTLWQNQYAAQTQATRAMRGSRWWLMMDAWNGVR